MKHAWDIRDGDVLGCVADIGWQDGHSMTVYGSLVIGGTGFLFESTPVYVSALSTLLDYRLFTLKGTFKGMYFVICIFFKALPPLS